MHRLTGIVAGYGPASRDFCSRHIATSLASAGPRIILAELGFPALYETEPLPGVEISTLGKKSGYGASPFGRIAQTTRFIRQFRTLSSQVRPDFIVSVYVTYGMLPSSCIRGIPQHVFFPDVPVRDTGRLGRFWFARAWRRLGRARVVWASDPYKAELVRQFGNLEEQPLVCYNCPAKGYLRDADPHRRDPWLRQWLQAQGAKVTESGTTLIRSGAIGPGGGIEETLRAMQSLPADFNFVLLGRATAAYHEEIWRLATELGLHGRVFYIDHPSESLWKRALLGADIGHLIQRPANGEDELFKHNSSLSNCRLFQYMAAGIPIISYDDPRMMSMHSEVNCFRVARLAALSMHIASAWRSLGADPAERKRLGAAGLYAHQTKYNWEAQFAAVKTVILRNAADNILEKHNHVALGNSNAVG